MNNRETLNENVIKAIQENNLKSFYNEVPKNVDVNARDNNGVPLIAYLIRCDRSDMLAHLIANKVDIEATYSVSNFTMNAVNVAASEGRLSCLRLLIESGAQIVEPPGPNSRTPLQAACKNGKMLCISLLIKNLTKEQLNQKDHINGWTAAHYAVAMNDHGCLLRLKIAGADLKIKSDIPALETPRDVARRYKHAKIKSFLKKIEKEDDKVSTSQFGLYQSPKDKKMDNGNVEVGLRDKGCCIS